MILRVNLENNPYDIVIERGSLNRVSEIFNLNRKVMIVTDTGVPSVYSETVYNQSLKPFIFRFEQGEKSKNIDTYAALLKELVINKFSRNDCVVAVGGGVVGDLGGFAAATYMRGIDFYNIPTTVLSQIDSSIGGKTAIDFEGYKNIVGSFWQPKRVLIDSDVLKTLNQRQMSNGLFEAVKMALTSDGELFEIFEGDYLSRIDEIIVRSLKIKKNVVEKDEREGGLRKILNFGHTIGHAVESVSGELLHGECVGLGMICMADVSLRDRLIKVLERLNLKTKVNLDINLLKQAMLHDKKADDEYVTVTYVHEIGSFELKKEKMEDIYKLLPLIIGD